MSYLKLLKHGHRLNIDRAHYHYCDKSKSFWMTVLKDICKVNESIAEVWAANKDEMITDALYHHYKVFSMSKDFATTISHFQKLSHDDLSDLYKL